MPDPRKGGGATRDPRGSETLLTTACSEAICDGARLGLPNAICAHLAGVSPSAMNHWLYRGRYEDDELYKLFYRNFTKAKAEGAEGYARVVHDSSRGGFVNERRTVTGRNGEVTVTERRSAPNAVAAMWWLEKRQSKYYGSNKLEMTLLEMQVKTLSERVAKLSGLESATGDASANQSGQLPAGVPGAETDGSSGAAGGGTSSGRADGPAASGAGAEFCIW